jgi:plasmid stabilization system protein ParE
MWTQPTRITSTVRPGWGEHFLERLNACVEAITDNPAMYGVVRDEVRAAPLRRFPYVVYCRVEGASVVIPAVWHGRRDSRVWQDRA